MPQMQFNPTSARLGTLSRLSLMASLVLGTCVLTPLSAAQDSGVDGLEDATAGELMLTLRMLPLPGGAAAPDARLEVLYPTRGERAALSDRSETWQLLVFTATWCEPCLQSLPTLQAVQELEAVSVRVVVEELSPALEESLADVGASFEVLLDDGVARRYRSESLPSAFLVSPSGAVAGLLRGARDFGVLAPLIGELVERDLDLQTAGFVEGSLELPGELAAPSARLLSLPERVATGEEFGFDVRITWAGELASYVPQAPKVALTSPDGAAAERLGVSAESSGDEGSGSVDYRLRFRAEAPGQLDVESVLLQYLPRYEGAPLMLRLPGGSLTIESRRLRAWRLAVPAALVLAVVVLVVALRRRSHAAPAEEPSSPWESLQTELENARRARLDGAYEEALESLDRVATALRDRDEEVERVAGELALLGEQIRFGGVIPAGDDLDRIHRLLERACQRLRPDPSAAEREALHLQ